MQVFEVGGAVRDELLGLSVQDRDYVVVGATPEQLTGQGYKPIGRDFPVFLHPQTHQEYALARTERKQGQGHQGFVFYTGLDVSLEDDLQRRDLTINAIAKDADGQLIDPYNGCRDLQAGILRHISPAFAEDPLRVLRVARFAARFAPLGFEVALATMDLMREITASGELQTLSAERIWQELYKALSGPAPQVFIQVLRDCGALLEVLPEIDQLFGVPQPAKHHPEIDTGVHILLSLEQAALAECDPMVVYAVLLHDLGKALTPEEQWPAHHGHELAGVPLVQAIGRRLKAPKKYTELAEIVCQWHLHVHRAASLKPGTVLKLFERTDAFRRPDRFVQFLQACEMDARGRTGLERRDYPQKKLLQTALENLQRLPIEQIVKTTDDPKQIPERIRTARLKQLKSLLSGSVAAP